MNHYVYRTARGLLRTVHAEVPVLAWNTARMRHRPTLMFNLSGEAWAGSSWPGCARMSDADVNAGHARVLYFTACAEEMGITKMWDGPVSLGPPRVIRMLEERGLYVPQRGLTGLGLAFVKHVEGAQ